MLKLKEFLGVKYVIYLNILLLQYIILDIIM
jgi:hypothetical protein